MSIIKRIERANSYQNYSVYEKIMDQLKANNIEVQERSIKGRIGEAIETLFNHTSLRKEYGDDEFDKSMKEDNIERIKHFIYRDQELKYDALSIENRLDDKIFKYYNFNEYLALETLKGLKASQPLPFELSVLDKKDCIIVNEIVDEFTNRRYTNPNTFQFLYERQQAEFLVNTGIFNDENKLEAYVREKLGLTGSDLDTSIKATEVTNQVIKDAFGGLDKFKYFVEDHHPRVKNPLYQLKRELLNRYGDYTKEELDQFICTASDQEINKRLESFGIHLDVSIPELGEGNYSVYEDYIVSNALDSHEEVDIDVESGYFDYESRTLDDLIPEIDDINSRFILKNAAIAETSFVLSLLPEGEEIQEDYHVFHALTDYIAAVADEWYTQDELKAKEKEVLRVFEKEGIETRISLDTLITQVSPIVKDIDINVMSNIGSTTFSPVSGDDYNLENERDCFINDCVCEGIETFLDAFDLSSELNEQQKEFVENDDYCYDFESSMFDMFCLYKDSKLIIDYTGDKPTISHFESPFYENEETYKDIILTIDKALSEKHGYEHGFEGFMKQQYAQANLAFEEKKAPKFYFEKRDEMQNERDFKMECYRQLEKELDRVLPLVKEEKATTKETSLILHSKERETLFQTLLHNDVRIEEVKPYADLSGKTLKYMDLTHKDLTGINFIGANLEGTKFDYSELTKVCLTNAILKDVKASHANLQGVELSGQTLQSVDFSHANLSNSNLQAVVFDDCKMQGINLQNANLLNAKIFAEDEVGIDYEYNEETKRMEKMIYSNSQFVDFTNANLKNANLSNCEVTRGIFKEVNLENANLEKLNTYQCVFSNSDLSFANLSKLNATETSFVNCDMQHTILTDTHNQAQVASERCDFTNATLTNNDFSYGTFTDCDFTESNLKGSDLTKACLKGSDFARTDLSGISIDEETKLEYIDEDHDADENISL